MKTTFGSYAAALVITIVLVGSLAGCAKPETARDDLPYRELSSAEREQLDAQRAVVAAVAQERYGVRGLNKSEADLTVLQRMLDDRVFGEDQTYELRSLGVAFGDVLASELPLRWMAIEGLEGSRPTLRFRDTPQDFDALSLLEKEGAYQTLDLPSELETLRKQLASVDTTSRPGGYLHPADVTKIKFWDGPSGRDTVFAGDDERFARILSAFNAAERAAAPGETTNDYSIQFYSRAGLAVGVYFNAGDQVLAVQTPHGENLGIVSEELARMVLEVAQ